MGIVDSFAHLLSLIAIRDRMRSWNAISVQKPRHELLISVRFAAGAPAAAPVADWHYAVAAHILRQQVTEHLAETRPGADKLDAHPRGSRLPALDDVVIRVPIRDEAVEERGRGNVCAVFTSLKEYRQIGAGRHVATACPEHRL